MSGWPSAEAPEFPAPYGGLDDPGRPLVRQEGVRDLDRQRRADPDGLRDATVVFYMRSLLGWLRLGWLKIYQIIPK